MRLDAMCCEVSLSHWIALGRLTVAPRYQRLYVGKAAAEGGGRGRARKTLCFASSLLLVPPGFEALVTFDLQLQLLVWRGHGVSYANDWSDTGINLVNWWLGRSYRSAIKMHLFDWGFVRRLEQPLSCVTQQDCCRVKTPKQWRWPHLTV